MQSSNPAVAPAKPLGQRLVGNSLWNVTAYFVFIGISFLALPIYLKYMGKAHYGILVLLSSLTAPLGLLNFGFGQATVKYVADSVARRDFALAGRFVSNTLLFNMAIGAIGAALLSLFAPFLAVHVFKLTAEEKPLIEACLHWTALTWFATQLAGTFTAVPTALQQFRLLSLGTMFYSGTNVLVSLVPLVLGYGLLEVVKVRFAWSLFGLAGWALAARHVLPQMPFRPAYDAVAFRRSFNFGVWHTSAGVGGLLANQADKFLLGIYLSAEAVGIFNIPTLIFTTSFMVVGKLGESVFPAVSDLHARGQEQRVLQLLLRASAIFALLMVCLQGTIFVFAHDILRLYVGNQVAEAAAQVLRIFAITAVIAAPSFAVNQYLLGTGATVWLAGSSIASGLLTLGASWLLVPRYGLAGAAWSDLLAIVLSRPLIHFLIWRGSLRESVSSQTFFLALYGSTLAGLPIILVLAWARHQLQLRPGWLGLGFAMLVVGTCLAGGMRLTDRWLPGGSVRWQEVARIALRLRGKGERTN